MKSLLALTCLLVLQSSNTAIAGDALDYIIEAMAVSYCAKKVEMASETEARRLGMALMVKNGVTKDEMKYYLRKPYITPAWKRFMDDLGGCTGVMKYFYEQYGIKGG